MKAQRNLMESSLAMWSEAEGMNNARTNQRPDLVDEMLGARLAMQESLRMEAAPPKLPTGRHPLHD